MYVINCNQGYINVIKAINVCNQLCNQCMSSMDVVNCNQYNQCMKSMYVITVYNQL